MNSTNLIRDLVVTDTLITYTNPKPGGRVAIALSSIESLEITDTSLEIITNSGTLWRLCLEEEDRELAFDQILEYLI